MSDQTPTGPEFSFASGGAGRRGPEPAASLRPTDSVVAHRALRDGDEVLLRDYSEEVQLRDCWRVIRRRRWTVGLVFLLTVGLAAVWIFTTPPVFTAVATLRIEREEPRVVKFEGVVRADPEESYYQTQYDILRSRALADKAIQELALDRHPEFGTPDGDSRWQHLNAWIASKRTEWLAEAARFLGAVPWVGQTVAVAGEGPDQLATESPMTQAFLSRLEVRPIGKTRLVELRFDSHYPDLAARVVNTLAHAFIAQNVQDKRAATGAAREFLAEQMEQARAKLEESEDKLNRFVSAKGIHFLTQDDAGERRDLVTQDLAALSNRLLAARAERIAKQSAAGEAASQDRESLSAVLASPVVGRLKQQLVDLQVEHRELSRLFAPGFKDVRMRQLEDNIGEIERRIGDETEKIVRSLQAEYLAAQRTEESLRGAVESQRRLARQLGDQMVRYNLLRREIDTNRELFTSLLTRLKETEVSAALLTPNVALVDRAKVPVEPSKPRKGLALLIAGALGLMGGVGLAFLREHFDTTLKHVQEVERALGVPVLAMVPSWRRLENRRLRRKVPFALVAHTRAGSVCAEAFRTLRSSLLFSPADRRPRTLLVTSLQVDDGKTSLATNLAVVLAQLGVGDILLVDGDLRRPSLHALLGVPQAPGLSTFLAGKAHLSDVVVATCIPNLYILPAGELPPNPAELMSSARVAEGLNLAARHFRHVVVDSPPLFGVSDARGLAPQVDGVLLVLRRGRTAREAARHAVRGLAAIQARLLGVVLNDVDIRDGEIGSDYAGYYGYYGYGPAKRKAG
jgi:succinoglycan biosynthesis transport protein ExoP